MEIELVSHLEVGEVDLSGGGDNVCLRDPPEGHAIDLVRTSDEKQAAVELLQEDDALAAEATGEEDEDGAGGDGRTEGGGLVGLAALLRLSYVLAGVEARGLGSRDETRAAVVRAANLLLLVCGDLVSRLGL